MTYPNVYATQTGPLALSGLDANFLYAVDIANAALTATAGGTADAITATYSPAPAALVAGLTLYVRAASANATTTPQFSPNGLTGKVITKNNNQALAVGDIAGAGHWLHLVYDATNGVWELINPATSVSAANFGISGNLNFSSTGNRITGDFSTTTFANRVSFQTSTVNGATSISALPNGTNQASNINCYNNSDPTNSSLLLAGSSSTEALIQSTIRGTGTYLPMTFYTGGSESFKCATDGTLTVSKAAGLGYGTGAGGTVTQATSKSTSVTLNKPTGKITMNNAALLPAASVSFQLGNSLLGINDTLSLSICWDGTVDPSNYTITAGIYQVSAGVALLTLTNRSAVSLSQAVQINFAVIKGATS